MWTPEEMHQHQETICQLLLQAGWLLNYSFTSGKGWHLGWTLEGTEKSVVLKRIIETYRLIDDDRAALVFDKITRGEALPSFGLAVEVDANVALFWRESVDAIELPRDEDHLLAFCLLILTWAPDGDTPVRFS